MAVLVLERGKEKGKRLKLSSPGSLSIGRDRGCELVVTGDAMVSRKHCKVIQNGAAVTVEDLGSSNGTFLNGRRLESGERPALEIEDQIQIGQCVLSLASDDVFENKGELSGRTIGGYTISDRVGRGAMGTVYRAHQVSLDRTVALKILARELLSEPARVAAFTSEARAAGKLNHPNIVAVFDVGKDDGIHYYSMEFMERGSVDDLVRKEGPLPLDTALRIAIDAAKGLSYAERQGVVHRDIKPANLMVNAEGTTKIGDLGIAKQGPTDGDSILGSPLYVAPEQAFGGTVDHRADLYSLGITIFQLVAGRVPFEGATIREVLRMHKEDSPPDLHEVAPEAPDELCELVTELLEKDPKNRPESASIVTERLDAIRTALSRIEVHPAEHSALWRNAILIAVFLIAAAWMLRVWLDHPDSGGSTVATTDDPLEDPIDDTPVGDPPSTGSGSDVPEPSVDQAAGDLETAIASMKSRSPKESIESFRIIVNRYPERSEILIAAGAKISELEALLGRDAEAARVKAAHEQAAASAVESLRSQIEQASGPKFSAVRAEIDKASSAFSNTASSDALKKLLQILDEKINAACRVIEEKVLEAAANLNFQGARTQIAELDALLLPKATEVAKSLRGRVDAAETAHKKKLRDEETKKVRAELVAISSSDDQALRRAFRFPDALRTLKELEPSLKQAEARRVLTDRVETLAAEEVLFQRLSAHVAKKAQPQLKIAVLASLDGVAISVDREGITFEGVQQKGIEVKKSFASLTPEMLISFLEPVVAGGMDQYALAHMLLDLGHRDSGLSTLKDLTIDKDAAVASRAKARLKALE